MPSIEVLFEHGLVGAISGVFVAILLWVIKTTTQERREVNEAFRQTVSEIVSSHKESVEKVADAVSENTSASHELGKMLTEISTLLKSKK